MRRYVTRKELLVGEACPRGYRMAWYDYYRDRSVCYPIGIHVIAWAIWRVWLWSMHPLPEGGVQELRDNITVLTEDRTRLYDEIDRLRGALRETTSVDRTLQHPDDSLAVTFCKEFLRERGYEVKDPYDG